MASLIPLILSFSPSSGAGNSVTGATKVTFGSNKAVFTVKFYTQITATVPTGAITGKIQVTTPGGTAVSGTVFTVN